MTRMQIWFRQTRRRNLCWLAVVSFVAGAIVAKILVERYHVAVTSGWGRYYERVRVLPETAPALSSSSSSSSSSSASSLTSSTTTTTTVTVVMASQKGDDTTWLERFGNWSKAVYVTDDPTAPLSIEKSKGREGMVYLTHIINHYDNLSPITIFSHAHRYQWHNDDPLYDSQAVLSRLNLTHIRTQHYANLRCGWVIGCPYSLKPFEEAVRPPPASDPESPKANAGSFYLEAFPRLFPNVSVPEVVGSPCCAQFAVTAERIRERPRAEYERMREWLAETALRDDLSGRILEYSWHLIFGQEAVSCPNAGECYCKQYGLCGLQCEDVGTCSAAYTLPSSSVLPEGWPDVDWDDKWQNATEIAQRFEAENRRGVGGARVESADVEHLRSQYDMI